MYHAFLLPLILISWITLAGLVATLPIFFAGSFVNLWKRWHKFTRGQAYISYSNHNEKLRRNG